MSSITIREIAKICGVSVSTVSRVLNNMPDVNQETKLKIENVISEHGYVPNFNAKTLKQTRTNIICLVVKGIHNPFFAPIVENIQSEIEKTRFIPLVHYIDEFDDEVKAAQALIIEKKALGIIFLGGTPSSKAKAISKLKVPCILSTMSAEGLNIKNASSVSVDDFESARKAIDYLIANGHRRIAILGGVRIEKDLIWNRYCGAKRSFEDHGLVFDEELYFDSKFTFEDSYERITNTLRANRDRFTAIFAMSDIMAIGATKAIYDSGLKVPDDISVIGFDGIKMATYYNPTITTVRQPAEEIARYSTELMIRNIQGEDIGRHILLDTDIVIGASVRKL